MKKVFTYLVVYIISVLVFYGGSGINIASFCCNSCQSEGISGIAEGICCEIHCHNNENVDHVESELNLDFDTHNNHCELSRIEHDWDSIISSFRNEPNCFELVKVCMPVGMTVCCQVISDITYEYSTGPPILCPRAYLSLLTVLLI